MKGQSMGGSGAVSFFFDKQTVQRAAPSILYTTKDLRRIEALTIQWTKMTLEKIHPIKRNARRGPPLFM
jgi:hypothetical protein